MKRSTIHLKYLLPILVCTIILLLPSVSQAFQFYIEKFHSDIVVNEDGTVEVTEWLDIFFNRDKHGIYRDIPVKYQREDGSTYTTPLEVISVVNNNSQRVPFKIIKHGNIVRIRIGDPNKLVSGAQSYRITYRLKHVILYFETHDEIYWNVTGNEWQVPIRESSASIRLDTDKQSDTSFYACYSGAYGSTDTDCDYQPLESGQGGTFYCNKQLNPGAGFTVVFGWDKGIVRQPSASELFWEKVDLANNWVIILPFITFFVMLYLWFKHGRDPKPSRAMAVQYEPPKINGKPLTPAEVGVLIDDEINPHDLSSGMISLAVKGFMTIERSDVEILFFTKTDHTLTKVKDADDTLSEFETMLLNDLFEESDSISLLSLKNKFYKKLPALRKQLFIQLIEKNFYASSPAAVKGKYIGMAIAVAGLMFFFIMFATSKNQGIAFVLAGLSGLIIGLFSIVMPRKTRLGAETMNDCMGFQEFLERAEKDKIERMQKEENIFYKYLPYAIALNVVDQWADAFKDLDVPRPNWYVGSAHWTYFSTRALTETLDTATSQFNNTVYSAPRGSGGSGGGGGGFSGGGSGGGGGGSW